MADPPATFEIAVIDNDFVQFKSYGLESIGILFNISGRNDLNITDRDVDVNSLIHSGNEHILKGGANIAN